MTPDPESGSALRDYRRILDRCEPYVIARPAVAAALEVAPLGLPIPAANVFDPQRVATGPFVGLVNRLDRLAYGVLGMPMPEWVFYDCAVMPGAIVGFARRATDLDPWVRRALAVEPGYEGLVPMSQLIIIPMAARDSWLAWSLCSINQIAPGGGPQGLWRLTLALGAAALGIDQLTGTTRWRSPRLGLYGGLGALDLVTAWTPAHDNPSTLTFRVACGPPARARLLSGANMDAAPPDRHVDVDDESALQALQEAVERGARVSVVGPARIRGAETRVPIRVRDRATDAAIAPAHPGIHELADGFAPRFQG